MRMAVEVAADPIRGSIDDGAGTVVGFAGWLELMSAVESACARAAAEGTAAGSPPGGGGEPA